MIADLKKKKTNNAIKLNELGTRYNNETDKIKVT